MYLIGIILRNIHKLSTVIGIEGGGERRLYKAGKYRFSKDGEVGGSYTHAGTVHIGLIDITSFKRLVDVLIHEDLELQLSEKISRTRRHYIIGRLDREMICE